MTGKRSAVVIVIMLILLFAAAYPTRTWVGGNRASGNYRLVVILKALDPAVEFWSVVRDGVEVAAQDYQVQVEIIGTQTETDIAGQVALLSRAAASKPDAMVL